MGASAWKYYVPYQPDIGRALRDLRDRVFRDGEYYTPDPTRRPTTVEQLLEANAEAGAHSILDIIAVGEQPSFGIAAPLSDADLVTYFGTDKPSHDLMENSYQQLEVIRSGRGAWVGTYVVLFDRGVPAEIIFFGCSGD